MKQFDTVQKIEAILSSIDSIEKADASPLFYSRLQLKMSKEKHGRYTHVIRFFAQPVVSIAAMFILILLNGFAISNLWQQQRQVPSTSTSINNFAKEYDLAISTAYEQ